MLKCAVALRNMEANAKSMEQVANRIVRYLYENFVDLQTGKPAFALVRLFKTHPYGELTEELQDAACEILKSRSINMTTQCLTLLATAGDEPQWNSRDGSAGHKAIPLVSEDFVKRAPMIFQLIRQFGLEVNTVLEPMPGLMIDSNRQIYNTFTFYIPEALGSGYIPAQQEFVIPYKICSVLGFGGLLPSGNFIATIMFTRTQITQQTADLFKWISSYTWVATTSFDKGAVFTHS